MAIVIFVGIIMAAALLVISAINKKRHPCALLGLLLLVAIVGAVVYLTGDGKDRCLDAGGAWSQGGKSCAFR